MPELPEVESTVKALQLSLNRVSISDVKATWARMIEPYSVSSLRKALAGRRVNKISRRAKYIVIEVADDSSTDYLLLHLRMSGRILMVGKGEVPGPHDRITLSLKSLDSDRETELRFIDPRKFGRFTFCTKLQLEQKLQHLGPEPLGKSLTKEKFHRILSNRKRAMKPLLLDQSALSGLGNIYVDESLWKARIHPLRLSNSLSSTESGRLFRVIRSILQKAIEMNGTDFGDGVVHNGKFVPQVYGRAGKECRRCKAELLRFRVAQRGTVVCNKCQQL